MKKIISEFKGLKHRFQEVGSINDVHFIDDSKATTVDAARAALSSCSQNTILIAGGKDKGSDYGQIRSLISEKVKHLILIGEAKEKMKIDLEGAAPIIYASDMDEAVNISLDVAEGGDAVLLSPMCSSFDMYKNYEERGDIFKRAIERLAKDK